MQQETPAGTHNHGVLTRIRWGVRIVVYGALGFACVAAAILYSRIGEPFLRRMDFAYRDEKPSSHADQLAAASESQIGKTIGYDSAYAEIPYPKGDVPLSTGVCADVVIRAFRDLSIDLQQKIHEDMRVAFNDYPQWWNLSAPNTNIDHRRVPNLMRYFQRQGKALEVSSKDEDYQPGDVVVWWLFYKRYHIGIVAQDRATGGNRPLIIHNIGAGVLKEDVLRKWPILGHYRW